MPTKGKRTLDAAALAALEPAALLGDLAALAEQIGSTEALSSLAGSATAPGVRGVESLGALRKSLRQYHQAILVPLELPAIYRAYGHASRYENRELIALDQELARERRLRPLAAASRRVGWAQLRRLAPLRDQRLVQRFMRAVEEGEACGWHTIVYGLVLALYSMPLRQGLLSYARQTTLGFINAAGRSLGFGEAEAQQLMADLSESFPREVEALLGAAEPAAFARV